MTVPGFRHWEQAFARAREHPSVVVAEPSPLDEPDDTWGQFGLRHVRIMGQGEAMIVRAGPERRQFEVWVSEKGRSVRLWVDNKEIPLPRSKNAH